MPRAVEPWEFSERSERRSAMTQRERKSVQYLSLTMTAAIHAIHSNPTFRRRQLLKESFTVARKRAVEPLSVVGRRKRKILMEKARIFLVLLLVLLFVTPSVPLVMASSESVSCPSRDLSAIVIGAGPAGLITALSLSKFCREVYLIEKHPTFEKRGSTFGIMTNGRKALAEIDPTLRGDLEQVGVDSLVEHEGCCTPKGPIKAEHYTSSWRKPG